MTWDDSLDYTVPLWGATLAALTVAALRALWLLHEARHARRQRGLAGRITGQTGPGDVRWNQEQILAEMRAVEASLRQDLSRRVMPADTGRVTEGEFRRPDGSYEHGVEVRAHNAGEAAEILYLVYCTAGAAA